MSRRLPAVLQKCSVGLKTWITRSYYAGPEVEDAVELCQRFSCQGIGATVGYWPGDDDTPRSLTDRYLASIDAIAHAGLDCSVSIKAMALEFDRDLVAEITNRAKAAGVGVHYDSRAHELADRTFDLIAESARHHPRIGCTLPGRWQRSLRDADLAVDLDVKVRVVKGQWDDPEHPEIDPRAGFLAVIGRLAGRARHVGVATHDPALAREALRRLLAADTACELEQLFGLPTRDTIRVARELGVRTRVYVPWGHSWVPYAFRWALANPRVLWWVARDTMLGRWSYVLKSNTSGLCRIVVSGIPGIRSEDH